MLGLKPGCKLCSESSHFMQHLLLQLQETIKKKKSDKGNFPSVSPLVLTTVPSDTGPQGNKVLPFLTRNLV